MKNTLDFNIQFSNLMGRSFPNCFAGAYVYMQNIADEMPKKCGNKENYCFGCGCSRDTQSTYFVLFDTLCGKSSLYWRFDGVMSDIATLIGDNSRVGKWSGKCGTDYTVDFLFGFAGYEYKKITNTNAFKDEIMASINSGKPVIAEPNKSLSKNVYGISLEEDFCVITGYDGDTFTSCYYHTDQGINTQEKVTITLSSDEIKTIYTFGNKIAPRYTLKDGLERIQLVMESTFDEKIWDDGIEQVNTTFITPENDELEKMSADELDGLKKHFTETLTNQFHCHIFGSALKHLSKTYDSGVAGFAGKVAQECSPS